MEGINEDSSSTYYAEKGYRDSDLSDGMIYRLSVTSQRNPEDEVAPTETAHRRADNSITLSQEATAFIVLEGAEPVTQTHPGVLSVTRTSWSPAC